ncbi:hypothetical protein N9K75_02935, partial [bacterium]|nr:hypothetical protein [bacterium]
MDDLICAALEGGSNYWYMIDDHNADSVGVEFLHEVLFKPEGFLVISDSSGEEGFTPVKVTHEDVMIGLKLFVEKRPDLVREVIQENWDADHADIFFQYTVLKDHIFG